VSSPPAAEGTSAVVCRARRSRCSAEGTGSDRVEVGVRGAVLGCGCVYSAAASPPNGARDPLRREAARASMCRSQACCVDVCVVRKGCRHGEWLSEAVRRGYPGGSGGGGGGRDRVRQDHAGAAVHPGGRRGAQRTVLDHLHAAAPHLSHGATFQREGHRDTRHGPSQTPNEWN
jgi:hypothetical protein